MRSLRVGAADRYELFVPFPSSLGSSNCKPMVKRSIWKIYDKERERERERERR